MFFLHKLCHLAYVKIDLSINWQEASSLTLMVSVWVKVVKEEKTLCVFKDPFSAFDLDKKPPRGHKQTIHPFGLMASTNDSERFKKVTPAERSADLSQPQLFDIITLP